VQCASKACAAPISAAQGARRLRVAAETWYLQRACPEERVVPSESKGRSGPEMTVEHASLPFAAWESFYVIVGSSGAALTGLQFVVIVLGAEVNAVGGAQTTRAFATPTVVHFCAVLLISAIMSAPWHGLSSAGLVVGACGVAGLVYTATVIRHLRRPTEYVPVLEDWIWHCALPLAAYAGLLAAAIALRWQPVPSLFTIGATALLLLFVGIHNAWDAVTYIAHEGRRGPAGRGDHERRDKEPPRTGVKGHDD
jgi:hypothetical protein